jgi:hypothetical protein
MLQIYKVNYGDLCLLNADIQIDNEDDIYIITAKFTPSRINFLPKIEVLHEILEYKKKMSKEDELGLVTYTYKIKLKAKKNMLPEELFILVEKTTIFNIQFKKLNKNNLTNDINELQKMKIILNVVGKKKF